MKLDDLDRNIIKNLQEDARLSLRKLGRILDVPHTTIFTRVNKLVDKGIIKHFSAILHPHDLGFKINYVIVDTSEAESKGIAEKVAECAEVMKVFRVTGGKIIIKAISPQDDPKCLQNFLSKLDGFTVNVYPIEEVVKYDHKVGDEFVDRIG